MYPEWGDVPAAGVLAVIGSVQRRPVMVVANDATVKAGAFFPQTVKKVLRAQRIATAFRLPLVYLVDSAGVFLPFRTRSFPTRTTSDGSSATTPSSPQWAFPSTPR